MQLKSTKGVLSGKILDSYVCSPQIAVPMARITLSAVKNFFKKNWRDLKSTEKLLREIRDKERRQSKRTLEQDAQITKEIPIYLEIESERRRGAGLREIQRFKADRLLELLRCGEAGKVQTGTQSERYHEYLEVNGAALP